MLGKCQLEEWADGSPLIISFWIILLLFVDFNKKF